MKEEPKTAFDIFKENVKGYQFSMSQKGVDNVLKAMQEYSSIQVNAALSEAIEKLSKTSTIPMWAIKIHIEILEGLKIKP